MRALALLAFLLLPMTGCVMGSTAPDFQVRIDTMKGSESRGYGQGILIDAHTVVTVAHVVNKPGRYLVSRASAHEGTKRRVRHIKARFLGLFSQGRSVEPLSVLVLEKGMWCSKYPEFRPVEPGDSGSPIMGKRGAVVGLITGHFRGIFPGRTILGTNGPMGAVPRDFAKKPKRRKRVK